MAIENDKQRPRCHSLTKFFKPFIENCGHHPPTFRASIRRTWDVVCSFPGAPEILSLVDDVEMINGGSKSPAAEIHPNTVVLSFPEP